MTTREPGGVLIGEKIRESDFGPVMYADGSKSKNNYSIS